MVSHEIKSALDPFAQRFAACKPSTGNVDHSHHRATGEIKRSDVRLRQDVVKAFGAYFDDEIILEHAAAHLAVDHERNTAEHLLFLDSRLSGQGRAEAGGKRLVVCHCAILMAEVAVHRGPSVSQCVATGVTELRIPIVASFGSEVHQVPDGIEQVKAALIDVVGHAGVAGVEVA